MPASPAPTAPPLLDPATRRDPGDGHVHAKGRDHDHDHSHDHDHGGEGATVPVPAHRPGAAHAHSPSHRHSHGPGRRHPPARPGFSLLRLSAMQRLAIALPLAALIWALALVVLAAGGA
ncbi:hypothetical protein FHS55_002918 [Angulomicrobium tetraedrale]|uniref:Uncharacterized protein n=1 Tax=Ancylobacter tetraedralis TaxID=217068 RepID=A0A839ZC90_9HYPH|nr:hypothetical protein [Ancylobacter tetraedralis]MBB3772306.1 hypothetical protein [Ancylobacter tetraedralis]